MNQRSFALVLFSALWLTRPASAQDLEPAPAPSAENEMPPGEAPRAKSEAVAEPVAEGSIKDSAEKHRPFAGSALAYVPFWHGVGIGLRAGFEIPIMHNGFLKNVNDSFSLEPSFAFAYGTWNNSSLFDDVKVMRYTPALSALWSFYFNPKLRLYGAVSFGYTIVNATNYSNSRYDFNFNYFYHEVSVGMFYDFAKHWSLRADLGYMGMRAGIAFLL